MKDQRTTSKRTYSKDELNQLLLKEAFERDLSLFSSLLSQKVGAKEQSIIGSNWTFTVVKSNDGTRELFINIPTSKK